MKANRKQPIAKKITHTVNDSLVNILLPTTKLLIEKSILQQEEYSKLLKKHDSLERKEDNLHSAYELLSAKMEDLKSVEAASQPPHFKSDFAVMFEILMNDFKQIEERLNERLSAMNQRERALVKKDFLMSKLSCDLTEANTPSKKPKSVFWEILQEEMTVASLGSRLKTRKVNPRVVHRIKVKVLQTIKQKRLDANAPYLLCRVVQLTLLNKRNQTIRSQSQVKQRKRVEEILEEDFQAYKKEEIWLGSFGKPDVSNEQPAFNLSSFMVKTFRDSKEDKESSFKKKDRQEDIANKPFDVIKKESIKPVTVQKSSEVRHKVSTPPLRENPKKLDITQNRISTIQTPPTQTHEVNPNSKEFLLSKKLVDRILHKAVLSNVKRNKLKEIEQKLEDQANKDKELKALLEKQRKAEEMKTLSERLVEIVLEQAISKDLSRKAYEEALNKWTKQDCLSKQDDIKVGLPFNSNTNSYPKDDYASPYSRNRDADGIRVVELSDSMEMEDDPKRMSMEHYLDLAQRMKDMAQESKAIESSMKAITGSIQQKTLNS